MKVNERYYFQAAARRWALSSKLVLCVQGCGKQYGVEYAEKFHYIGSASPQLTSVAENSVPL
jgi:hypothetical protein